MRGQPFARAPITHRDATLTPEVVLGVFCDKYPVFTAIGACVAGFSLHFAN
jgi:hypothetical protein